MPLPATLSVDPIVGKRLSSVDFVEDYVQLRFEGDTIVTLLVWPMLIDGERIAEFGQNGYDEKLGTFVGEQLVGGTVAPAAHMTLDFGHGRRLRVRLDAEAYEGRPEAIIFKSREAGWWVA